MANISNEASNTQKMREHQVRKQINQLPSYEETDLIVCAKVVNLSNSVALNASITNADLVSILNPNPNDAALVSDVDHQLLLKILFEEPVTVTSASFRAEKPPGQEEEATLYSGPKKVLCYANHPDLDFVDTDAIQPAQIVELTPDHLHGRKVALRGNRFSRCRSVQFFVEQNQDET